MLYGFVKPSIWNNNLSQEAWYQFLRGGNIWAEGSRMNKNMSLREQLKYFDTAENRISPYKFFMFWKLILVKMESKNRLLLAIILLLV
jgi:hypothetical protein